MSSYHPTTRRVPSFREFAEESWDEPELTQAQMEMISAEAEEEAYTLWLDERATEVLPAEEIDPDTCPF